MKRKIVVIVLAASSLLALGLGVFELYGSNQSNSYFKGIALPGLLSSEPVKGASSSATQLIPQSNHEGLKDQKSEFRSRLTAESEKIALLDENPSQIEKNLKGFAESLSDHEIKELYDISLDLKQQQDERFLAVTLLSWTQKSQVATMLEQIILAPIDPFLSSGQNTVFEEILRMKAIEGLRELPLSTTEHQTHLISVIQRTSNQQLLDRAQRALWSARGLASPPEQQDHEALEKVLKSSAN